MSDPSYHERQSEHLEFDKGLNDGAEAAPVVADPEPLNERAVVAFLTEHPDFFRRHPELLNDLDVERDVTGAVSLVERQLRQLRARNGALAAKLRELLSRAQENDTLFRKVRGLTLALFDVQSWPELNAVLASALLQEFEADFVACHVTGMDFTLDHFVTHPEVLPTDRYLNSREAACATLRAQEMRVLFPHHEHTQPGSAVFASLGLRHFSGCLVLGSRSPARFVSDMDTLFVTHVGEVLAKSMDRL